MLHKMFMQKREYTYGAEEFDGPGCEVWDPLSMVSSATSQQHLRCHMVIVVVVDRRRYSRENQNNIGQRRLTNSHDKRTVE